jgi:hypothetical protein
MSHLARRALASGQTEMTVDLLTGEAGPTELVGPPVDESIAARVRWLPSLLASQRIDPAVVREARMRIVFDTSFCATTSVEGYTVTEVPFDCWVTLLDDHNQTHTTHFRRVWPCSMSGVELGVPRRLSIWQKFLNAVVR